MESYSWYRGHSYQAHHWKSLAQKNKACHYHPYHGSTSSFFTDFWWWEEIYFRHWIERLHFYFPLNFIATEHQPLLQVFTTQLRNDLDELNLDYSLKNSYISKYLKHICFILGICLTWTVLAGCLTFAGKYIDIVPQGLHQSAKSLSMFYIPATQIWLLAITIPYFALLICAVISDGFALVMALQR